MNRLILAAAITALSALPAFAGVQRVESSRSVDDAVSVLKDAIDKAGAKVVAVVNHGAGAKSVGADIGASQLVIFGNPAVGTPAMETDRLAGLRLPLKILIYEDRNGQVWLAYDDPKTLFQDMPDVDPESDYVVKMTAALQKLTGAAK